MNEVENKAPCVTPNTSNANNINQRNNSVSVTETSGNAQQKVKSKIIGNYILGKNLGEGTFGKVKMAAHIISGEKVAIKVLEKDRIIDVSDVERVSREIHILKLLRHNNIVQLYEIIETPKQLFLITEYASGGELFDYIVCNSRVKEKESCIFFQQIINGIDYIHKLNIVHRDMKPENLMLTGSKTIKIIDFGLSNTYKKNELLKTACGSPCYAAPEMIAGKKYQGIMVDLWSCGVILYALICGYLPFEDPNTANLYKKILAGDYQIPKFVSPDGRDIIKGILNTDPVQRFTIQDIRNHKWFNQLKPNIYTEGIIVGYNRIPVDLNILKQLEQYNINIDYAQKCIEANKHNHATTTYYLLLKKFISSGGKSSADLASENFDSSLLFKKRNSKTPVTNLAQTELLNSSLMQDDRLTKQQDTEKDKENQNKGKFNQSRRISIVTQEKDLSNTQKNGSTGGSSSRDYKLVNIQQNLANQSQYQQYQSNNTSATPYNDQNTKKNEKVQQMHSQNPQLIQDQNQKNFLQLQKMRAQVKMSNTQQQQKQFPNMLNQNFIKKIMKDQINPKNITQLTEVKDKQNLSGTKQNMQYNYFEQSGQSPTPIQQQMKIETKMPQNPKFSTQPNTSTNSPRIDTYYERLMNKRKMFNFQQREQDESMVDYEQKRHSSIGHNGVVATIGNKSRITTALQKQKQNFRQTGYYQMMNQGFNKFKQLNVQKNKRVINPERERGRSTEPGEQPNPLGIQFFQGNFYEQKAGPNNSTTTTNNNNNNNKNNNNNNNNNNNMGLSQFSTTNQNTQRRQPSKERDNQCKKNLNTTFNYNLTENSVNTTSKPSRQQGGIPVHRKGKSTQLNNILGDINQIKICTPAYNDLLTKHNLNTSNFSEEGSVNKTAF